MTANELADNLEKHNLLSGYACMAADLLRKQQAQIEELIKHLEFAGIVVERKAQEK